MTSGGFGGISTERIQVRFTLERDDEEWPPVDTEEVWAVALDANLARVDSIPWFIRDIAVGDLIDVQQVHEGRAVFRGKLKWSGNCTLRVIPLVGDVEAGISDVIQRLSDYGVQIEVLRQFGLVAVNVSPSVDLVRLKRMLEVGEERGWWSWEEGCIGGAWPS